MSHATHRLRIAVLGAGAWGTALAAAAARYHDVYLWGRNADLMDQLQASACNTQYLPHIALPPSLRYTADLSFAIQHGADCPDQASQPGLIVLANPVAGLRHVCEQLADALTHPAHIVWTCKGLEPATGQLPHEVAQDVLTAPSHHATGVLSGPSFAKEVAQGLPVALTVGSHVASLRARVSQAFHHDAMRIYATSDVIGVEVGGALKNIIAIACGIADGLSLGNNARAALITRGLAEITRFGVRLGAEPTTFSGLTGLGDLVLTTTGELSRNRQVGLALGRGQALQDILASGLTAEGVRCARAVNDRSQRLGIDMPITQAVCKVLFEGVPVVAAVSELLARESKTE